MPNTTKPVKAKIEIAKNEPAIYIDDNTDKKSPEYKEIIGNH